MTRGYQAHAWMLGTFTREPRSRRVQKGRFCTRLDIRRPTINKYLKGGGIPFPFPPAEHLVFVIDADDRTLRWVSPSLCLALQHAEEFFVGRDAETALRGSTPADPGHVEAIEAMRRGELDSHACRTTFVRGDGYWVPLDIQVSYGDLYRVWFVDAVLAGEPARAPSITEQFSDDEPNTHSTLVVRAPPGTLPNAWFAVPLPRTLTVTAPADLERQAEFLRRMSGKNACDTCHGYGYVRRRNSGT